MGASRPRVGRIGRHPGDWSPSLMVYRANVGLPCIRGFPGCEGIGKGELFTRVGYPGGGPARAPACRACQPFDVESEASA